MPSLKNHLDVFACPMSSSPYRGGAWFGIDRVSAHDVVVGLGIAEVTVSIPMRKRQQARITKAAAEEKAFAPIRAKLIEDYSIDPSLFNRSRW